MFGENEQPRVFALGQAEKAFYAVTVRVQVRVNTQGLLGNGDDDVLHARFSFAAL